jgi:hypothetical protein
MRKSREKSLYKAGSSGKLFRPRQTAAGFFVIFILLAAACEGPAGPEGPQATSGDIYVTVEGGGTDAASLTQAIAEAINGKVLTAGSWNVTVSGVDLSNPWALKNLYHGIAAALSTGEEDIALNLSGCTGYVVEKVTGLPRDEKERFVSLVLPDSVTIIADGDETGGAFAGFTRLAGVTAGGVTYVGQYAFYGCSGLQAVDFPLAADIGNSAFLDCFSLSTVTLPAVRTIDNWAFARTALSTVNFPATSIGGYAFAGCTSLLSIDLPAASIGGGAFAGCISLTNLSLPAAATIGGAAFSGCTSLSSLSLPAAASIGGAAFSGCTILSRVTLTVAA